MFPGIDPNSLAALESLDLGDVQSADGRSHPVTATTPVMIDFGEGTSTPATPSLTDPMGVANDMLKSLVGSLFSTGTGKRALLYVVVVVAALILLTVSAFRLTSPSSQL